MSAASMDDTLVTVLGSRTAKAVERAFGYATVGELLAHYPRRYAHHGEVTELAHLPVGEQVTLVADVRRVDERRMNSRKGTIVEALISDGTGVLSLTFFNQPWRRNELVPGARGVFAGKITRYKGMLQLAHPEYKLFDEQATQTGRTDAEAEAWARTPVPIYPATASLPSWTVQKSIALALDHVAGNVVDPLPEPVRRTERLLDHGTALERVHRPETDADWRAARRTLRFHEAFLLQAALLEQRAESRGRPATPRTAAPGGLLERFDARLPFRLTGDQERVGAEIAADMARPEPMNRLVQGEVGSGKTLVALRAMLAVAESGGQTALLAPTEVLATQHLRSIMRTIGPELSAELMPTLLTGQMPAAARRKALLSVVSGRSRIVVGTHALLGDAVEFYDLGLVVVDEQHRFGVDQRDVLRRKAAVHPHTLVLTATPIPRTVAMTVFGDLDVSTIRELPAGRAGISTFTVPLAARPGWMPRVWERVREEVDAGRQAFVVCPAIDAAGAADDESVVEDPEGDGSADERRAPASVVAVTEELRRTPALESLRIGSLHGRMPGDEKDEVMRRYAAGDIDVLVSTTVIEVGVDVPNASTMVVLDADRFGVSQLHQLRGRVGRGSVPGLCLLVTEAEPGTTGLERVDAVAATLDGFELAQRDLELRREGDVLGGAQSGGRSSLRLLRVASDGDLIQEARTRAEEIIAADQGLEHHPALRRAIDRRLDDAAREAMAKS